LTHAADTQSRLQSATPTVRQAQKSFPQLNRLPPRSPENSPELKHTLPPRYVKGMDLVRLNRQAPRQLLTANHGQRRVCGACMGLLSMQCGPWCAPAYKMFPDRLPKEKLPGKRPGRN